MLFHSSVYSTFSLSYSRNPEHFLSCFDQFQAHFCVGVYMKVNWRSWVDAGRQPIHCALSLTSCTDNISHCPAVTRPSLTLFLTMPLAIVLEGIVLCTFLLGQNTFTAWKKLFLRARRRLSSHPNSFSEDDSSSRHSCHGRRNLSTSVERQNSIHSVKMRSISFTTNHALTTAHSNTDLHCVGVQVDRDKEPVIVTKAERITPVERSRNAVALELQIESQNDSSASASSHGLRDGPELACRDE